MDTKFWQQKIGCRHKKPPLVSQRRFVFAEGSSTNATAAIAGGC
jgi:hypothetical protein